MTAPVNKTPLSVDYTSRDYYSLREQLIARVKDRVPGWTGNDSSDFGLAIIEAFAYMGDLVNYYIDRTANEGYILTATQRDTLLNLARMYGYTPNNYVGSVADVTFTNNNGYQGAVGGAIIEDGTIGEDEEEVDVVHMAKLVVPNDHPFQVDDKVIVESFTNKATGVIAGVVLDYNISVFNGTYLVLKTGYDNIGNNVIQYRPEGEIESISVDGTLVTVSYSGSINPQIGQKVTISGVTVGSGDNGFNGNWFVENSTDSTEGTLASFVFDAAKHVAKVTRAVGNGTLVKYSTFDTSSAATFDVYNYRTPSWHIFTDGQKVTVSGSTPSSFNGTTKVVSAVKDETALITNIQRTDADTITVTSSKEFEVGDIVSIRNIRSLSNSDGEANERKVAAVTGATSNGTKITYTTSAEHGFPVGTIVTITGASNSSYNVTQKEITDVTTSSPFTFKVASTLNTTAPTFTNGLAVNYAANNWNFSDAVVATVDKVEFAISGVVGNAKTGITEFTTKTSMTDILSKGQYVTITGMNPGVYNLKEVKLLSVNNNKFTVSSFWDDEFVGGGKVTLYKFTIDEVINSTESVSSNGTIGAAFCKQFSLPNTTSDSYVSGGSVVANVGGTTTLTADSLVTYADLPVIINPGGVVKDVGITTIPSGAQLVAQVTNADGSQNIVFSTQTDVVVPFKSTANALVVQGEQVSYRAENAANPDVAGDISGELLGYSSGEAVQSFDLKESRVDEFTVKVFVSAGNVFEEWTRVAHIMDYGPSDEVFEVYISGTGTVSVIFGDGISGKIPVKESVIKARYVAGGGVIGNVPAGAISTWGIITPAVDDDETGIKGKITVTNADAASGGLDPESNDSIRYNAPRALRTLNRAVTLQDFMDLALSVDRVAKVNAIAGKRNSITLYMAPVSSDATPGVLGEDTTSQWDFIRDNVQTFLSDKVQIGASVTILPPRYTDVGLEVTYTKAPEYSGALVESAIKKLLLEEFSYDNLDFGDVITPEEVEFKLRQVPGVVNARVDVCGRMIGDVTVTTMSDFFGRDSLIAEPDELFMFTEDNIILTGASTNAALSALTTDTGTLVPAFNTSLFTYRIVLPNDTTEVEIIPTASDVETSGGAPKITVNGSRVSSGSPATISDITVGNTLVTVIVTAGDGVTVKVYKITLIRAA